jgi:hypothetical protein
MPELVGFPMLSQRDSDVNALYNCVAASIAAALEYLTGKTFRAGEVKDAVYGSTYVGGTAGWKYVAYCAQQGVKLEPINGNGDQLVAALHAEIAAGHACLITETDPYASGWTHVCAAYKCDGGSVTVMDPWIDEPVWKSDATWATQLADNQIWRLELENAMLTIADPWVAGHFVQSGSNPDRWHCAKTNQDLFAGILDGWCKMNGAPRLPTGPEVKCGAQAVYKECESGIVLYDPGHELDAPGGPWEPCYLLKLDSDLAKKLLSIQPPPTPTLNTAGAITSLQSIQGAASVALKDLGVN